MVKKCLPMNRSDVYVGIDTSAYTTSVAVVSGSDILIDNRKMLAVPQGARGLRQSDAVFAHIKNFPELFRNIFIEQGNIKAVAYSEKPCPKEGSYMPVFCVGASHAAAVSAAAGAGIYALTHQHGHIYAGFFGNTIDDGLYGAFHVSGGTLDLLRVCVQNGIVSDIRPLGGSLDITCGQLIDRVGVAAGMAFPSGAEMEKLYKPGAKRLAVHVDGLSANLSGAETQAQRRLQNGEAAALVCSSAIDCAAQTLTKLLVNAAKLCNLKSFLFTGGVICNTIIRENIQNTCDKNGLAAVFAKKHLCSDNACGLALAAQRLHGQENRV